MSDEITEISTSSELELGKLKFQEEALAEAKLLGLVPDEEQKDIKTDEVVEKATDREFSEVEKEQIELGWDPNKTGPTAVSAEEFKRVGQIIEAKRAASKRAENADKKVEELTKTVKALVDHGRKLEKASYEKALNDLQSERDEKILTGDLEAVKELDLKEKVLQKAKESVVEEPVIQEQQLSKEANEYIERNRFWLYGTEPEDKKMQILTNKVIDYLKEAEPNISEKDAIAAIEDELRLKFPNRFDNPNKEKAPAVIGKSTSTVSTKSVQLSTEERMMFLSIKNIDPTFTVEEYVKQLETIGRR